jgi:hypothetical protein
MAVTSFIPEIWAASLLRELEKDLVYGQSGIINRDYEGEISQAGDTVHIGGIGAVTIREYDRTAAIEAPETLATSDQSLLIDQEMYYNFKVNDVDRAQVAGDLMGPAAAEAAYGLADVADEYIAGLHAGVDASMLYGSDIAPVELATADDAYDLLVDLAVMLDEANVPVGQRFAVIPPWLAGFLAKDTRILTSLGSSVIPNGFVGQVSTLRLLKSNNVPNYEGDLYKIIAGYPGAWTFAQQILKTEAYRVELGFDDAVKGLHVYGAKVVRSTKLAVATVTHVTGS